METIFSTNGTIINQDSNATSSNPKELNFFKHKILSQDIFLTTEEFLKEEWYLEGEVPLNIIIDSSGTLSGNIVLLHEQTKVMDKYPLEDIKEDGSNWLNNGRPKAAYIDFNFIVCKKTYYKDLDLLETLSVPNDEGVIEDVSDELITKDIVFKQEVIIRVIKSNDIDNLVFAKNYMDQGYKLKIGDTEYGKREFFEYIKDHPGPFGI